MMTSGTQLTAFTLAADEGRTREPLNILGQDMRVKVSSADSDGALAVFHADVPPMSGPPLHRHSREDEWLYVIDGQITVEVDGRRTILGAGGSAFVPRGTAHTFQNFGPATAHMLATVTPGENFNQFFEEVSALNRGLPVPDLARTEQIMNAHGLELLGPPLS